MSAKVSGTQNVLFANATFLDMQNTKYRFTHGIFPFIE